MTRLEALVLRAFAVWTVYVWTTRIWNILGDETTSTAFKVVHSVLAVISIAFAVAGWLVVRRVRRRGREGEGEGEGERGRASAGATTS